MAGADWRVWCRSAKDIAVEGERVTVALAGTRTQRVGVRVTAESIELESVVAHPAALESVESCEVRVWRRNRASQGVAFRFDAKGRLVADGWIPLAGATAKEFLAGVRRVAAAADLFEYQLTGADRE